MEINKIYNDDVFNIMKELEDNSVDMIYSEPDYGVGISYKGKKYISKFNEYVDWYIKLAKESFRILKEDGNMFFINYPKQNAHLRVKLLDDICYSVNEYVWVFNSNVGHSNNKFTTAHRTILHSTKSKDNRWFKEQVAEPYKNPNDKRIIELSKNGSIGRMPYSWMYYDLVKNVSKEKTNHPCQMPRNLVEKLFKSSTKEGDLIFIHFGGSGGEIVIAEELKRNWISAELVTEYYEMINKRLENNGKIPEECKLVKNRLKSKGILIK